jgi:hypothetical protein
MYYFDILNGPSYLALIKEFWMKPTVVTKSVYLERIKAMVAENPELEGKTPGQMGLRSFAGTKIESFVCGFRVGIRLDHIYEALKLTKGGVFFTGTESVEPEVEDFNFKDKVNPQDKPDMKNINKIIY